MDSWELDRIKRLEGRVDRLEQKNWERSMFWFRVIMYGVTAALVIFVIVTITLDVSNAGHS